MKNIFKYLLVLTVFVGLTGCEEDLIVYSNTNFIQIRNANSVSITENGGQVVQIDVQLGGPRSTDTQVAWNVVGPAGRFEITPAGGAITIPAGETQGSVFFSAIDDDEINGDVTVTLGLADNGVPVGLGGEGVNSVSKSITIVDDNVPCNAYNVSITADRWGSEVMWDIVDADGNIVAAGGPYDDLPSGGVTTDDATVNLEDGCYTFRQFDWFGDGWGAGGAVAVCGALTGVDQDATLDGIPGLDLSTVPVNPLYGTQFNGASDPFVDYAEQVDFCVNQ